MTRSLSFGAAATDRVDCGADWIGVGDITVCGWINPKDLGGSSKGRILDNGKFYFLVSGTFPNIALEAYSDGSANFGNSNPGKLLPNSWSFVSLTRAATTGTVSFRINGIDQTSDSSTATPEAGSTNVFIGNRNATDRNFNGKIKNLQVFNRILTTTEQDNIYYAGIMPSDYATSIIRDFRFLENDTASTIYSYNNNSQTGTITGATYSNDVPIGRRITPRFMGGSTLFNGSSSTISMAQTPANYVSAFTFCARFKLKAFTGVQQAVFSNALSICEVTAAGFLRMKTHATTDCDITSSVKPVLGWNTVVGTYDVATNSGRLYLNNAFVGSGSATGNVSLSSPFYIGSLTGTGRWFGGNICEAQFYNQSFTASQAAELYSTGSVSGVSPVASYALDDQPSTYIDSIGANNGTGTATTYSSDKPIGERKSGGNFPTTATIDNFNRPNAATLGSSWTDAVGGFAISGNTAVGEDADFNIATLNSAPSSADCEVYAKIADVVTGGKAGVYLRWSGGSGNGYGATVDFLDAGHSINVYRTDSFTDTTILTIAKQFADGDSLGMQMIGSALRIYHKDANGGWTYLGGVIDSTYSAAGALELVTRGTSVKIDSFSGGNFGAFLPTVRRGTNNLVFNGSFSWAPDFIAATTTQAAFIDGTALGNYKNSHGWAAIEKSGTASGQFDGGVMKISTLATNSNFAASPATNGGASIVVAQGYKLVTGVSYTLSGRMKTNLVSGTATTGARILCNLYSGAGTYLATYFAANAVLTTTDWTTYSVDFTPTSGQPLAIVTLQVRGNNGAATLIMDAWFDDISLTQTTPTTRTTV